MTAFLWTNSFLSEISADLAAIRAAGIDVLYSYQMGQGPATASRPAPASDAQMLAYLDALNAAGLKTMLEVAFLGKNVVSGRENKVLSSVAGYSADLIPTMTSNTAPSGVASASSAYTTDLAWHAFDDAATRWITLSNCPGYLAYQFATAKVITQYIITAAADAGGAPTAFKFQGSTNGTTWVDLDTRTGLSWAGGEKKTFAVSNSTSYAYHRLWITACVNAGWIVIIEWEMMATVPNELAALTAYVNKWKSHPAVWGWYADDEGGAEYPISTRHQVYDAIKAAHPAGQVFETHYALVPGAYSPDVHDVFAADAGSAGAAYVYKYDDIPAAPNYGCISKASGLVTSTSCEVDALNGFRHNLISLKADLDAAGETNYLVCMQAFKHTAAGTAYVFAMPPAGGLSKMFAEVQAAGWDFYGVGWFLWKSNDAATMPGENMDGVGESDYSAQRSELATIAGAPLAPFHLYEPPRQVEPTTATYCVKVAGQDITELVDLDTMHRSLSERGEASATIDIPVASENEVPVNGLTRDAVVDIHVDGEREWLGHVVAVHKPQPQDLSYTLDCAGGWDTLHHCAPWCKGFVETRYDAVTEYPASFLPAFGLAPTTAIDVSTDGEVLLTLPKGTKLKANQCKLLYLWILGGIVGGFSIERITCDVDTSGSGVLSWSLVAMGHDPFNPTHLFTVGNGTTTSAHVPVNTGTMSASGPLSVLKFLLWPNSPSDIAEQTSDQTFQVRNIRAYIDRTTAPRVDEIVAAIDAEVRPGAPAAITEAIGSPITAFMLDPFMTPADGIAMALTKAAVPPLCGVIQNQLVIKNRPTAPPDAARLWTVSEQLTPGLEWGVEVDEEQSVDYVSVAYNVIGDALLPDGTLRIAYPPPSVAARTGLIDGGDLTAAEAAFYAAQGYHFLHKLVSGPVTIPYVVRDANGNERPADVIRQWDWVQNVGLLHAERAGPFLVSEVEHQGHIATLTIGAAEAYAYNGPDRMPTKGRYVGGYRTRKRTKKRVSFETYWHWKHRAYYKKHKKYPNMPKKHAKYGTTHGWKWIEHEGRYT